MTKRPSTTRISTGVENLDGILAGGLPQGSLTVLAGPPGGGKTILSQQVILQNASPTSPAIFFQTLSEPTAKTLKYATQFDYFRPEMLKDGSVYFIDLGALLRLEGVAHASTMMMEHIEKISPRFVVVDSFKVFMDLAKTAEELRKFSYEIAVNLMAWEVTALLLGEFSAEDIQTNPLFSIADGIMHLSGKLESGEQQRMFQVSKMRGTNHSRDEHPFSIGDNGISIYAPKVTIRRESGVDLHIPHDGPLRIRVGVAGLDQLLADGIPSGSSILISGVAGTGKTLLSLEFIYRGAKEFGEKGIYISFEETHDRLLTTAKEMGWDLQGEISKGNINIIVIPQTDVLIEKDLLAIQRSIESLKAKRIAVDSISLFVYKVQLAQIVREKIFQLATLVQKAQAVGFFVTDLPYGSNQISHFGIEGTIVDGVILLKSETVGKTRTRSIEVYKLRNTSHEGGQHALTIGSRGIEVEARMVPRPSRKPKVLRKKGHSNPSRGR